MLLLLLPMHDADVTLCTAAAVSLHGGAIYFTFTLLLMSLTCCLQFANKVFFKKVFLKYSFCVLCYFLFCFLNLRE